MSTLTSLNRNLLLQPLNAQCFILVAFGDLVYSPEEIDNPRVSFKPEFLHHFIEDEIIRGYEEPRLDFFFAPLTMDCYFRYTCKSRTRDSVNLETFFETFFLNGLITERPLFEQKLQLQADFCVPGKLVGQVVRQEAAFDTYLIEDITEPHINNYLKNFQIFLKFFIETGSYVDDSDHMWKHILMIERVGMTYQESREEDFCRICLLLSFLQRASTVQIENQPTGDPSLLPKKRSRLACVECTICLFSKFISIT